MPQYPTILNIAIIAFCLIFIIYTLVLPCSNSKKSKARKEKKEKNSDKSIVNNYLTKIKTLLSFDIHEVIPQLKLFCVFCLFNFALPFFMWRESGSAQNFELALRFAACTLCFICLLRDYVPSKFYPCYFHNIISIFTVVFCLPFLSTLLFLQNNGSLIWQVNIGISLLFTAVILEWVNFLLINIVGTILAFAFFFYSSDKQKLFELDFADLYATIYLYIFAILIGGLFSKNKQLIEQQVVKKLKDTVDTRTSELELLLKEQNRFVNNVSHEVRGPMHGIASISGQLVELWGDFNDQEKLKYVKIIASNSKRLFGLVSNILDMSRFNLGKIVIETALVDFADIAKDMIDECEQLYLPEHPGIKLSYDIQISQAPVVADKIAISQVLRNLFSNAIKYSKRINQISLKKKNSILAKLVFDRKNKEFIFSLRDEGLGIPEEEKDKIFDLFYESSRTSKNKGGTGIGLAIAKEIIDLHDGKIWVENNKNSNGSTFFISLPAQNYNFEEFSKPGADFQKDQNLTNVINSDSEILVVDDEKSCLIGLEMIMRQTGLKVIPFDGGSEALEYIEKNHQKICLVLLDMMMPDINGTEVLEQIRKNPITSKIKVILQSGSQDERELSKIRNLGIEAIIYKPFTKDEVLGQVRSLLGLEQK